MHEAALLAVGIDKLIRPRQPVGRDGLLAAIRSTCIGRARNKAYNGMLWVNHRFRTRFVQDSKVYADRFTSDAREAVEGYVRVDTTATLAVPDISFKPIAQNLSGWPS